LITNVRRWLGWLGWLLPPLAVVMLFDRWSKRQNERLWHDAEESWARLRTTVLEVWAEEDGVAPAQLEPMIRSAGLWCLRDRRHVG
jgi:hypothetical protein